MNKPRANLTTVVDQYRYNGNVYYNPAAVADAAYKDGHDIDLDSIPSEYHWAKTFWKNYGVDWNRVEVASNPLDLQRAQSNGVTTIDNAVDNFINRHRYNWKVGSDPLVKGLQLTRRKVIDRLVVAREYIESTLNSTGYVFGIVMTLDDINERLASMSSEINAVNKLANNGYTLIEQAVNFDQVDDAVNRTLKAINDQIIKFG